MAQPYALMLDQSVCPHLYNLKLWHCPGASLII